MPYRFRNSNVRAWMVVAATISCFTLAGGAWAQEQRVVFVQVLDQQGQPVTDLAPEEFQVAEDRVPGRVVSARIGTDPMRVALLVDNGEAMRAGQAVNPMRDAVAGFIETLPPQHLVSLFTIGGQIRQVVDFTTDRGELVEEARGLFTDQTDGVRFVDSIRETLERRYDEDEMWPVFVTLITDSGEASAFLNERRYRRFIDSLRARGAIVHVVQWNSARRGRLEDPFDATFAGEAGGATGERFARRGRRSLVDSDAGGRGTSATHTIALNLTEVTGGRYVSVAAATGMVGTMTQLAADMGAHYDAVSTRYKLTYERPDPPGQRVMMRVTRPAVALRLYRDRAIVAAATVGALSQVTGPAFTVASLEPSAPEHREMSFRVWPGGSCNVRNHSLTRLISEAYELEVQQVLGGPDWINDDRFDVVATFEPDSDAATDESRVRRMLQRLLRERFALRVSAGRLGPVDVLVVTHAERLRAH